MNYLFLRAEYIANSPNPDPNPKNYQVLVSFLHLPYVGPIVPRKSIIIPLAV